jgi:hypothetical protein
MQKTTTHKPTRGSFTRLRQLCNPDTARLEILRATAEWLAGHPDVRVISFDDLTRGHVVLN